MRVVITGATSMIGVAIIKECLINDDQILAIVRKNSNKLERIPKSKNITYIYADLRELNEINFNEKYDVFFHLAWENTSKENRDNPKKQLENVKYTMDAIDLARRLGCQKFVAAGSQAEYGITTEIITEETNTKPLISYGMAKLAAKMLGNKLCDDCGIIFLWARICSVYGVNDNDETLIKYLLECAKNNEIIKLSSCNQYWNYLFEDDAGKMIYLIGKKGFESQTYLVANPVSIRLKDYVEQINRIFDYQLNISYSTTNPNSNSLNVDMSKTISLIGDFECIQFSDGIKKIINQMK